MAHAPRQRNGFLDRLPDRRRGESGARCACAVTGVLCLAMFTVSGAFANFAAVAVLAAIAEITPNEFRGQVTALYTGLVGLLAALGPVVVGALNDHWPGSGPAIAGSLSVTFAACAIGSVALLLAGQSEFRRLKLSVAGSAPGVNPPG